MSASGSPLSERFAADVVPPRAGMFRLAGIRALVCILCLEMLAGVGVDVLTEPDAVSGRQVAHLSLLRLPDCALHTTLRMATVLIVALVFSVCCALVMVRSARLRENILSFLTEMRTIPVCGFLVFVAPFFSMLMPAHGVAGECLADAAVFPVLAGPMTASFLQAIGEVPGDLTLMARGFRLTGWQMFWRLIVPVSVPALVRGMARAMPYAWLALLWTEIFIRHRASFVTPGLGAYVSAAASNSDGWPVVLSAAVMMLIVAMYDWFIFQPALTWSYRFVADNDGQPVSDGPEEPWMLQFVRRAPAIGWLGGHLVRTARTLGTLRLGTKPLAEPSADISIRSGLRETAALTVLCALTLAFCWQPLVFHIGPIGIVRVVALGFTTLLHVMAMVFLVSAIWIFPGVWLGKRLGAIAGHMTLLRLLGVFPTVMLFPLAAALITAFRLSSGFWLMPLLVTGPQWLLATRLISSVAEFPKGLFEAARAYNIRGWMWWRSVVLPGLGGGWLAGARAAFFGAWNLAIAAEFVRWGNVRLTSEGIGSYIAEAMEAGDSIRAAFSVTVMTAFAALLSALVWEPLTTWVRRRTTGAG